MTWRELSTQRLNELKNVLLVDVRSPIEHESERIPGSFNLPLLSNEERAQIGTVYKQDGEMVARRQALSIISPKIPDFVEAVATQRRHGQTVVVYCWRGGLRSESVASVLSIAGIDCFRLTGGYKAWRSAVLKAFQDDSYPFNSFVLVGQTGTGKTEILQALQNLGQQVLDLEALANHRGSVFGGLGLGDQPTQKNFDAELWSDLRKLDQSRPVFLEGESRKIGRLALPDCVFHRIEKGRHILVTGSLDRRAERIAKDYLNPKRNPEAEKQRAVGLLDHLKVRLGAKTVQHLQDLITQNQVIEAVKVMLLEYYDPLYNRQIERCSPYALQVDGDDPTIASIAIAKWSEASSPHPPTTLSSKPL